MTVDTPKGLRLHIGIFGRVNVGKSSFLNAITSQDVSITSPHPGTTTDVVEKAMELLPVGPVLFLDTAGLGDESILGEERVKRSKKVFDRADVIVLVVEPWHWGEYEDFVVEEAKRRNQGVIVVINKIDISPPSHQVLEAVKKNNLIAIEVSALKKGKEREQWIARFKSALLNLLPDDFVFSPPLLGDLLPPCGFVVFVVPIDLEAPKGRLILPQVQAIRDVLDNDAMVAVVKEKEYLNLLERIKDRPDLVVCDSQVVKRVVIETPEDVRVTTFSILFSRFKGDLLTAVRSVRVLDRLKPGDRILIAEACSHHPIQDDIGRVKIPRWICQFVGGEVKVDVYAGKDYPEDLSEYKLVVHCGGCVINRRMMLSRIQLAKSYGVPITNYGVCISYLHGVLERVLSPFPEVKKEFLSVSD